MEGNPSAGERGLSADGKGLDADGRGLDADGRRLAASGKRLAAVGRRLGDRVIRELWQEGGTLMGLGLQLLQFVTVSAISMVQVQL